VKGLEQLRLSHRQFGERVTDDGGSRRRLGGTSLIQRGESFVSLPGFERDGLFMAVVTDQEIPGDRGEPGNRLIRQTSIPPFSNRSQGCASTPRPGAGFCSPPLSQAAC